MTLTSQAELLFANHPKRRDQRYTLDLTSTFAIQLPRSEQGSPGQRKHGGKNDIVSHATDLVLEWIKWRFPANTEIFNHVKVWRMPFKPGLDRESAVCVPEGRESGSRHDSAIQRVRLRTVASPWRSTQFRALPGASHLQRSQQSSASVLVRCLCKQASDTYSPSHQVP